MYIQRNIDADEPLHDETNEITCAPSEDPGQPGHV